MSGMLHRQVNELSRASMLYVGTLLREWGRWKVIPAEKRPDYPNAALVDKVIATLPDELQELVTLKFVRGLPVVAIAASVGITRQRAAADIDNATAYILGALGK